MIESYPLTWPVGRPRIQKRQPARFHQKGVWGKDQVLRRSVPVTTYQAIKELRAELDRLGATEVVISSNVQTRRDGLPYSQAREPDDPAVACYFRLQGEPRCLPSDKWDRVADNVSAIVHHIKAVRGIARWGVGDLAQIFAGFKALPAMGASRPWWKTLGFETIPQDYETARKARHRLLVSHHPDKGGNHDQAAEINSALDQAWIYYNYD